MSISSQSLLWAPLALIKPDIQARCSTKPQESKLSTHRRHFNAACSVLAALPSPLRRNTLLFPAQQPPRVFGRGFLLPKCPMTEFPSSNQSFLTTGAWEAPEFADYRYLPLRKPTVDIYTYFPPSGLAESDICMVVFIHWKDLLLHVMCHPSVLHSINVSGTEDSAASIDIGSP
ncbi:hypothetical protein CIHG_04156 [Coccidioides immitis H538.4]|uniref:Uncharacterized protein n=1 Tax=Coccidioides immitis H538.4 TaxID=396776 RepID=A0A0J8RNH7_COCIT|nr:hypothetical protein CIHG_04156 [Coccidioides immitis H538.4]